MNKVIAICLSASISICFIAVIFTEAMTPAFEDGMYTLAGLGMIIFGIWASILLFKK